MKKPKPVCQSVLPWLQANLGTHCIAPLTGTDAKALRAAVHIVDLYSYDPDPEVAFAFGNVVRRMQPETRELAYHAIAHVMDWGHRESLWVEANLPAFTPRVCAHER